VITLWVLYAVLVPLCDSIINKILLQQQHLVHFGRVNSIVELKQVLDPVDKNCEVLLLVAALAKQHKSGALCW
jgi:hypothetical protein